MSVAQTQMCSAPAYEAIVERDIMMSLRDGVRLATDLYFPALDDEKIDQRFPVVLTRTPYDKLGRDTTGKWFAERGYVFAAQDVRGRYASEGVFYPYAHEGPDGYDTVEWLAQQPFCTGKVGTLGSSYGASVISALAALNPPHLAAIIHLFGPSSHYHCSMRNNGTLEMRFFAYALSMAATSREAAADPALKQALEEARADVWAWAKQYPLRKGNSPLRLVPSYEQWAIDISTHATYDDYWKQPGYGPRPYYDQHADVPSLYIGGWYDSYTLAVVENFQELSKRGKAPVHMLMGPWHHGSPGTAISGDLSFKPDATLSDCNALYLRWFDHWLKGLPTGLDETKSVRYFIMGGGEGLVEASPTIEHGGKWATCDAWPPPNTTPTPFYFHADGSLSTEPPDEEDASTTYTFDPGDPVPTIGGHLSILPIPPGGYDQRQDNRFHGTHGRLPLSARGDMLCFITEPLEEDLVVTGPLVAKLYVSTDGLDTDFTVKLLDIYPPGPHYPNGCALNITDSIHRLRFRNSFELEELAEPGTVYELEIEMYPTGNRFVKGHQIRVDISSSNYPRFEVNPNTGGVLGVDRRKRVAQNTLYHDKSRPSHLTMWVVEK